MGSVEQDLALLREAVREAHGAIQDLERLLREVRQVVADGTRQASAAMEKTANRELTAMAAHIQREADRNTADLNRAVTAARQQIVAALTVKAVEGIPGRPGVRVEFAGNLFDAGERPGDESGG